MDIQRLSYKDNHFVLLSTPLQSYLGHLMSYAACIGPHQGRNPQCSGRARH